MSDPKVYVLKSCDTCRKALKALAAAGMSPEITDLRAEGVEPARIARWLEAVGSEVLINRKSTTWRGLTEADRDRADTAPAALLAAHPTLIKRPVIEAEGAILVGWTEDTSRALGI